MGVTDDRRGKVSSKPHHVTDISARSDCVFVNPLLRPRASMSRISELGLGPIVRAVKPNPEDRPQATRPSPVYAMPRKVAWSGSTARSRSKVSSMLVATTATQASH